MPETISLKTMQFDNAVLTLDGYVFDDEKSGQTKQNILVDFIIMLNESPEITQASLLLSETGTDFTVAHTVFRVKCLLADEGLLD